MQTSGRQYGWSLLALALCGCGNPDQETQAAASTAASGAPTQALVTAGRLLAAAPTQWLTYGGTYQEQRYSTLAK